MSKEFGLSSFTRFPNYLELKCFFHAPPFWHKSSVYEEMRCFPHIILHTAHLCLFWLSFAVTSIDLNILIASWFSSLLMTRTRLIIRINKFKSRS